MCGLTYYILKYIIIISGVIINRYSKELDMVHYMVNQWSDNNSNIRFLQGGLQSQKAVCDAGPTLKQHWVWCWAGRLTTQLY